MMNKFLSAFMVFVMFVVVLSAIVIGPRILKDIHKKQKFTNTYAIQNVKTGKNIRVQNAGIDNGTKTILYSPHNWECMTWQFIQLEGDTYLLKNLYTEKTFQPSSSPESGVTLWQQTLGGTKLQYWEFIKQADETYQIRLKNTELYVTISSDKKDSPIILMPKQNSTDQKWRLIEQHPIV